MSFSHRFFIGLENYKDYWKMLPLDEIRYRKSSLKLTIGHKFGKESRL